MSNTNKILVSTLFLVILGSATLLVIPRSEVVLEQREGNSIGVRRRLGANNTNSTSNEVPVETWFCFWCPSEKQVSSEEEEEEEEAESIELALSNVTFLPPPDTENPTEAPTVAPTIAPTNVPTTSSPSSEPTTSPSDSPTYAPTMAATTTPSPTLKPTVLLPRLKMYWEKGYYWQDEDWDRVWCAAYHYDYEGYPCYYGQDEGRCRDYHIYIDYCREQDNEHFQRFEIVHLGNNNRIMIRIKGDWCWSYSGDYVEWQRCDSGNRRQQWIADVDARKFQIRSATKSSLCVTQHHHPKPGEVLELINCNRARETQTSYWNLYW